MLSTLTTLSSPAPLALLTLLLCKKAFVPLFISLSGVILPLFNFSLSLYGCHNSPWYSQAAVTLSITHLQAILEPADGPWVTRLIVLVVGLPTRPFIQEHKSQSQAVWELAALPLQCPPQSRAGEKEKINANEVQELGQEEPCGWGRSETQSVLLCVSLKISLKKGESKELFPRHSVHKLCYNHVLWSRLWLFGSVFSRSLYQGKDELLSL